MHIPEGKLRASHIQPLLVEIISDKRGDLLIIFVCECKVRVSMNTDVWQINQSGMAAVTVNRVNKLLRP